MTTPPERRGSAYGELISRGPGAAFSVLMTSRGPDGLPGLLLRRQEPPQAGGMMRRHLATGVRLWGSPGVAEANPFIDGDEWGPWEPWPWASDGRILESWGAALHRNVPATRADLEAAEPLDLLHLVAALWELLYVGALGPVIRPWIEALALVTIRADKDRPAWLDEAAAVYALRGTLAAALVELGEALGVSELEYNGGAPAAWIERGWTAEDGAWWLSSRAGAWVRARWGEDAAPADRDRGRWEDLDAGRASAWSLVQSWIDPEHPGPIPSPLVAWLAGELWDREVLPKIERERRWPSAILAAAYVPMVRGLVPATVEQGRVVDRSGQQLPLALSVPVDRVLSLEIMGRKVAQDVFRLLPDLARVAFNRAGSPVAYDPDAKCVVWRDQATGDALVEVSGGWGTLATLLNMKGKDAPAEVREVIRLLAMVNLEWRGPGGSGGGSLLSWQDGTTDARRHHAPGRQSTVTLRISPPLAPGLTHQMPEQRRALVPVLREPPPMIPGRPRLAASIGRLDLLAVAELRNRAVEVAERDYAVMNWDSLADHAELARRWVPEVLDVFVPVRWERMARGGWNLARGGATGLARDFIVEAGRAEIAGARGGRHGAAKRQGRKRVKTGS